MPTAIDWKLLTELRHNFLSEDPAASGEYWSRHALEQYDATFAQRIAWKWDAVLEELKARQWHPGEEKPWIVDWGCGTGIATRALTKHWPDAFSGVELFDRSKLAEAFAAEQVAPLKASPRPADHEYLLVLSHVLNEVDARGARAIERLARGARSILWVEPGTPAIKEKLLDFRERWREQAHVVAPCTHQSKCGLLTTENSRHWCHHFARPPGEVFHSAFWSEFSRRLGIDLRSLPVSYLVVDRRIPATASTGSRVIGKPRAYKGYTTCLVCNADAVSERKIRDAVVMEELRQPSFATFLKETS